MIFTNKKCVVIGRNQNPWKESNFKKLTKDSIEIVRRFSGGGAVYHDLGNVNFTLFSSNSAFNKSNLSNMLLGTIKGFQINNSTMGPRFDLYVEGFKVSGSAYKLTSQRSYHHSTMLINSNTDLLKSYLSVSVSSVPKSN